VPNLRADTWRKPRLTRNFCDLPQNLSRAIQREVEWFSQSHLDDDREQDKSKSNDESALTCTPENRNTNPESSQEEKEKNWKSSRPVSPLMLVTKRPKPLPSPKGSVIGSRTNDISPSFRG
jgi:hypothetical protein